MPRAAITQDLYDAATTAYRDDPGNVANVARITGLSRAAAKRLWEGPILSTDPKGIVPIRNLLREEAQRQHAAAVLRRVEEETAARLEAERRREVQKEADKMDESTLRVARSNSLGALAALAQLVPGITSLAKRVNAALVSGVDAAGNPVQVDPVRAVRVIKDFSTCTKELVAASKTLAEIERIKEGLPEHMVGIVPMLNTGTALVGAAALAGSEDDIGDAQEVIGRAQSALERAKRNQLAAKATQAGKELPTFDDDDGEGAALEAEVLPAVRHGAKKSAALAVPPASTKTPIVVQADPDFDPDLDDLDVIDDLPDAEEVGEDDQGYVPAFGPSGVALPMFERHTIHDVTNRRRPDAVDLSQSYLRDVSTRVPCADFVRLLLRELSGWVRLSGARLSAAHPTSAQHLPPSAVDTVLHDCATHTVDLRELFLGDVACGVECFDRRLIYSAELAGGAPTACPGRCELGAVMRPCAPRNDATDVGGADVEPGCEFSARCCTCSMCVSYSGDVSPGKLSDRRLFAREAAAAPLLTHVSHVVGVRAQKQVCRVHARRVVAPMQDGLTCRDIADQQFICCAVRLLAPGFTVETKRAVASATKPASPQPATTCCGLIDPQQKPLKIGETMFSHAAKYTQNGVQ